MLVFPCKHHICNGLLHSSSLNTNCLISRMRVCRLQPQTHHIDTPALKNIIAQHEATDGSDCGMRWIHGARAGRDRLDVNIRVQSQLLQPHKRVVCMNKILFVTYSVTPYWAVRLRFMIVFRLFLQGSVIIIYANSHCYYGCRAHRLLSTLPAVGLAAEILKLDLDSCITAL